jgi:Phage minor structural protein GP20
LCIIPNTVYDRRENVERQRKRTATKNRSREGTNMKREFLKGLNLDDAMIDKILDEHSRHIGAEKAKTESAVAAKTDLESQLSQRDKDLSDLKKAAEGNETLTQQLTALQESFKTEKTAYEERILDAAIKLALAGKVHDAGIVGSLIDKSKIELDEQGNVKKGLDTQIDSLKTDKAFLFVGESQQGGTAKPTGFKPADGSKPQNNGEINPFAKETFNLTEQGKLFKADPQQARQMAEAAGIKL